MRCESCNVTIGAEFTHAISNNQCPACGKSIMQKAQLAAFLSLRTLLDNQIIVKGVNVDKLASLIMANFEVKQLFKEGPQPGLQKDDEEGIIEVDEEEDDDPDAEHKAQQLVESKQILQKMRDEVLAGAVQDRYGFGDEDNITLPDDANTHEIVNKELQRQRHETILTGGGGFTRTE